MTPILLTGPAIEPVTLAEAKAWLRISDTAEDDLVSALITSSRMVLEAAARVFLIDQTWRLVYDQWPGSEWIGIPLAPFRSVSAISVYDVNNTSVNVVPSSYVLDTAPMTARLKFVTPPPAPGRRIAGIELDVVLGFGAQAVHVPGPLRQAIKMLVARGFENRGDAVSNARQLPGDIMALISGYRRMRLK